MNEWLAEGFRYDLWANRVWAEALGPVEGIERANSTATWPDFPVGDPLTRAREVFLHIFFAERIWLARCGRDLVLDGGPEAWTQALCDGWIAEVGRHELDERIDYRNTRGEAQDMTFGEIVAHVLRHSAYHRGQLREIFQAIRPDDIPQT